MKKLCPLSFSFQSFLAFLVIIFSSHFLSAQNECSSPTTLSGTLSGETNVGSTAPAPNDCGGDLSVWYEVEVLSDGTTLDILINEGTISNSMVSIYLDDCSTEISSGNCSDNETAECLVIGDYYVQVSSATGDVGDFDITETQSLNGPANDLCINATDLGELMCNMPLTLAAADPNACADTEALGCLSGGAGGTWFTFTTAATLTEFTLDGGDFNLFEGSCGSLSLIDDCAVSGNPITADNATTYFLLVDGSGSDVEITVPSGPTNDNCSDAMFSGGGSFTTCCSATGEVWFEVQGDQGGTVIDFDAPAGASITIEIFEGPCGGNLEYSDTGDFQVTLPNCSPDPFLMKVSSADCIDFDFAIMDGGCGGAYEDICSTSAPSETLQVFSQACINSCTQLACSANCGTNNGVWFQVDFAEAGTNLLIEVNGASTDFGTAIISVFEGDCVNGVLTCEITDMLDVSINASSIYFIEVANDGVPGDFEICFTLTEEFDSCAEWSTVESTRPENPDKDPEGPFCPGETVNFCSTVNFTIDQAGIGNNCQWLQGVIPVVGEGWDLSVTSLDSQTPNPIFDGWFDDVEYSPHLPSTNPVLSLGSNANGLTIDYLMGGGLMMGDILPGGWYGLNAGGLPACTDASHPNGAYGISGGCGSMYSFELCFDLTVKFFNDVAECESADLDIRLFAMADGMTGCWSNTTCAADEPAQYVTGMVDCSGFTELVEVDEKNICSGDPVDITIETTDGSDTDIWVEVYEVDNVTGAEFHEPLVSGSNEGLLEDVLENCETSIETVTYLAFARGLNCDGPPIMFDVNVFPKLTVEFPEPIDICPGDMFTLTPIVMGGAGAPYDYEWRDENNVNVGTGPSLELPISGQAPGFYTVTFMVTDGNGCRIDQDIEYNVVPPLNEMIIGPMDICISNNQMGTQYCAEHDLASDIDYLWIPSPGLFFTDDQDDEKCINIDELRTVPNTYTLRLEITDEFFCVHTEELVLTISNGPTLMIVPDGCNGAALELLGINSNHVNVPSILWAVQASGPPGTNGLPTVVAGDTIAGPSLIDSLMISTTDLVNSIQLYGESSGGCTPPPVTYTIPPVAMPDFVPPATPICEDASVTMEITNYNAFSPPGNPARWTDGVNVWNMATVTDSPTINTTYTFIGTNALNCEVTESFQVVVNPIPQAEISGSSTICAGTSTELIANTTTGTAPFSYTWDDGTTEQNLIVNASGDYFVTITDANGCNSTDSHNIQQGTSISFAVMFEPYCLDNPNGTTLTSPTYDSYQWFDDAGPISGATNQTYDTDVPGNYYVEIVDGACTGQSDPINVQGQEPLQMFNPPDEELCNASGTTPGVEIDLTALIPPGVQGSWCDENDVRINSPESYSVLGKPAGTIGLTFKSNNAVFPCDNYEVPLDIIVNECGCPSPVAQLPDQCVGDGIIDLTILTNDAGTWSSTGLSITGSTLDIDANTVAGVYTLEFAHDATLPANCTLPYETTFEVFVPLVAEFSDPDPVCNSTGTMQTTTLDLDGLIMSSSAPGTWSTLETDVNLTGSSVDFEGSPVGGYTFSYTIPAESPTCGPGIFQVTVRAEDCDCPRVIVNAIPDQCNIGGLINLNSTDVLDNPTGLPGVWTMDPDVGALLVDQIDLAGIPEATYTLTYTLSPPVMNCDAINSQTIDLVVSAVPDVTLVPTIEVCNGLIQGDPRPIELDMEALVSGDQGTWSAPLTYKGGVIDDINAVNFLDVAPGDYMFDYEVVGEGVCDNEIFSIIVTVSSCNCPVYPTNPTVFCNELGILDLNTIWQDPSQVEAGTFTELTGPTAFTINGSSLDLVRLEGRYFISFTPDNLAAGCDPQEINITVETQPVVTIPGIIPACNQVSSLGDNCINFISLATGAAGVWTADPDFLLTNSFNDPTDACFDGIAPGDYEFIFTVPNTNNECDPQDYTVTVSVSDCDCPNILIEEAMDMCSGTTLPLSSLETTGIADGSWSVDNPGSQISNGEFVADAPGTYTLRFTPTDAQPTDCDDFSETTFNVNEPLSAGTSLDGIACVGSDEVINLFDLLEDEDAGGSWSEEGTNPQLGGLDDIAGTFDPSGLRDGTYEFMYLVPAIDPCASDEVVVAVEIAALPVADAGLDVTISCAETTELGGDGTTIGQGVTYMWTADNGTTIDDPTNQSITTDVPATYTLEVTDANGCINTDEVVVTSDGGLAVDVSSTDPGCFGEPGILIVTQLSGGNNLSYSLGGEPIQTSDFDQIAPGEYTLTIEDENGCRITETFIIAEAEEISVDAGEDRQIDLGGLDTLQVGISIDAAMIQNIIWVDQESGDTLCSGLNCRTLPVDPEIFNIYCVTVIDINGCEEMACVTIREKLVKDIYIPNVFNPDEVDESNKTFHVHADQFVESVNFLNIFDRWGELVYAAPKNHLPNMSEFGWNGRWNNIGNDVEPGVYVYVLEVQYVDTGNGSETEIFAGDLTIFR